MPDETMFIEQINDNLYMSARAYIVNTAEQLPRAMASEWKEQKMNESFLWIAGRYVQANQANKNNDYWSYDDIVIGESSIKYTPLNVLHKWDRPVGTFVETKIVHRQNASDEAEVLPEVQALAVLWTANFPNVARAAKDAHDAGRLWYSMECTAETTQCMACERTFSFRAAANELCEHLTDRTAARRWINPTFLGGALIFPPSNPGWKDADITSVAADLTRQYANRDRMTTARWEDAMSSLYA
ncbi:MAG: hypothetical protein DRJ28_11080 [Actinobacteria bacterium]|nr:MAG: hypothetical protein DRJ28_11080 [Actinomycetota bacterium]